MSFTRSETPKLQASQNTNVKTGAPISSGIGRLTERLKDELSKGWTDLVEFVLERKAISTETKENRKREGECSHTSFSPSLWSELSLQFFWSITTKPQKRKSCCNFYFSMTSILIRTLVNLDKIFYYVRMKPSVILWFFIYHHDHNFY